MGGKARIVVYAPDRYRATLATIAAFREIARQEEILSDYMHSSVSRVLVEKAPNEWHDVNPDLVKALALSRGVWEVSGGAFDPTIGPVTHLWRPAFKSGTLPDTDALGLALERVGMQHLELDEEHSRVRFDRDGMLLDFGGVGKGFAAEKALDVLREHGCPSALVDLGGDLALGNPPPGKEGWRITIDNGLELPHEVLLAKVLEIAATIASKSPLAIAGTKEMLNYTRDHDVTDSLNYMATWQAGMFVGPDLFEAAAANREKRAPRFADLLPPQRLVRRR